MYTCFYIYLLIVNIGAVTSTDKQSRQLGTEDFPHFDNGDMVEFYYIEGVFPFTTPDNIVEDSGDLFTSYSLTHAGLGVWNKETHLKMSIELVSDSYVGALLPSVVKRSSNCTTLVWNNSASIVLTKPINDTFWSESRLLAVSDGAAFNNLRSWIRDHQSKFSTYQPVRVHPYSAGTVELGQDLVGYLDSYKFVEGMLQSLADYGVKLQTFLDVQTTGFSYLAAAAAEDGLGSVKALSWAQGDCPPQNVTDWYGNLSVCYEQTWASCKGSAGAFLEEVAVCYSSGYAFVYDSPWSVKQVQLAEVQDPDFRTPLLWRDLYELPAKNDSSGNRWDLADSLLLLAVGVGLLVAALYFIYTSVLHPTPRRKVSIHWEEQATQIVSSMVKKGGGGAGQGTFYRGRDAPSQSSNTVMFSSYIDPPSGASRTGDGFHDDNDEDDDPDDDDVLYRYFTRPTSYRDPRPTNSKGLGSTLSRLVHSIMRPSFESESTVPNRSRNSTTDTFQSEQGAAGRSGVVSAPGGTVWGRTALASSVPSSPAPEAIGPTDRPPAFTAPTQGSLSRGDSWGRASGSQGKGGEREERALSGFSDDLAEFLSMPSTIVHSPGSQQQAGH